MSSLSNYAALGVAALLGTAQSAGAEIDLARESLSATGAPARVAKAPRINPPLIVLRPNPDLPAMVKSDPLVVVLSLPQHGKTDLAQAAAFEYALTTASPSDKHGSSSNLVLHSTLFADDLHKAAVAAGVSKVAEHFRLIDSLKGIDSNPTNRVTLYTDESLRHLVDVYELLPKSGAPADHQARLRDSIHIARNLFFAGSPVDEGSVSTERLKLSVFRDRFYPIKPFEGRSVVFLAHSELMTDYSVQIGRTMWDAEDAQRYVKDSGDVHRFGKAGTQQRIREEALTRGGSFTFLRAERPFDLDEVKAKTLRAIETTPPGPNGFIFIFDGHGGPDGIQLSSAELRASKADATNSGRGISISGEELAASFRNRAKHFPVTGEIPDAHRDIGMIVGCFSQNFVRNLGQRIGDIDSAPYLVSAAEFGQYGYSLPGSPYGSKTFHPAFAREAPPAGKRQLKPSTTFGDLITLGVLPDVRPTFFVPERAKGVGPELPVTGGSGKPKLMYRQIGALRQIGEKGNPS